MANNLYFVYQFALPFKTNDGIGDYTRALAVWEALALDEAGGFTYLGERAGSWRNDEGKTFSDRMAWYEVATDPTTKNKLVRHAVNLFPDQESFYVSGFGGAEIVINSDLQKVAARPVTALDFLKAVDTEGGGP